VLVIFAREFCLHHILKCWFGVRHTLFFDFVGCTLQLCVFVSNTLQHMKRLLCPLKVGPTCQLSPSPLLFSSVASAGQQHGLPFLCVAAVPDVELLARTPRLGARLRFDLTARREAGAAGTPPPPWVSRARRRYSQNGELPARRRPVSRAQGRAPHEHVAAALGSTSPSARKPDLGARRRRRGPVELPAWRLGPWPHRRHLPGRVPHGMGSLNSGSPECLPGSRTPTGRAPWPAARRSCSPSSCAALRRAGPKRWS
jgi:hypothetical protein